MVREDEVRAVWAEGEHMSLVAPAARAREPVYVAALTGVWAGGEGPAVSRPDSRPASRAR